MTRLSPFLSWVAELPMDAVQPPSARAVLSALAAHADGGRDDPAVAELASLAGCTSRTVERHVAALRGVLLDVEEGRSAEGWRRNRYRLLAPLNVVEAAEAYAAAVNILASGGLVTGAEPGFAGAQILRPADTVSGGPADTDASHPTYGREASRQSGLPADTVSGGAYKEQARAGARPFPSFHPSFSEFDWGSEAVKANAARVLSACGPGLAPIENNPARMLGSLAQLLTGEWAKLDLDRDVIAVVKETTRRVRRSPLCDFRLPARDVAASVGRTLMRGARSDGGVAARGVGVAAPVASPTDKRAERIAALGKLIGIIESGQRPEWMLDAGERVVARSDAEAAFARAMERYRAELAGLEASGDGGGNG